MEFKTLDAEAWVDFCKKLFPNYRGLTKEEKEIHRNFVYKLFKEQKDPDPEIQEVTNNHFWELFED
jgi:hypothetical protein